MPTRTDDDLLALRAAELYYERDLTQDQIGDALGVTRWKAGRLLVQARERGIVRIDIVHPAARRPALERALTAGYGLTEAIVTSAAGAADDAEIAARVTTAAARLLAALDPAPRLLGVSWGRTMQAVADALPERWAEHADVVQINGGLSLAPGGGTAAGTAGAIARRGGGEALLLPIPAVFERPEIRAGVEEDRAIAPVLARALSADAYLFGVGEAGADSALVHSGYLDAAEAVDLVRRGAVGDVVGRFIDADGAIVDPTLDARTVGIGHDALRAATRSIAVVAGSGKSAIARAVVASGLATILVTDERVAADLLTALADAEGSPASSASSTTRTEEVSA